MLQNSITTHSRGIRLISVRDFESCWRSPSPCAQGRAPPWWRQGVRVFSAATTTVYPDSVLRYVVDASPESSNRVCAEGSRGLLGAKNQRKPGHSIPSRRRSPPSCRASTHYRYSSTMRSCAHCTTAAAIATARWCSATVTGSVTPGYRVVTANRVRRAASAIDGRITSPVCPRMVNSRASRELAERKRRERSARL